MPRRKFNSGENHKKRGELLAMSTKGTESKVKPKQACSPSLAQHDVIIAQDKTPVGQRNAHSTQQHSSVDEDSSFTSSSSTTSSWMTDV
ncbi:hypothetical protein AVEN_43073-1 [Araneus ventricosus]|uniref:Uncharacterized protein n=1 Tax=Araneus ventricosus TaxID=182803 RepID=A0A4Y2M6Q3_ARAVE|nr:hypothetical protein AVEN_43073-1 [Araneus ventricosus]